mmetsp:Transcript_15986/g.36587  ORF Transcript_15986/g.36587 Transcript_15986/m.36587 type:complete len:207 (-) Transcript_15986:966-1586(-)
MFACASLRAASFLASSASHQALCELSSDACCCNLSIKSLIMIFTRASGSLANEPRSKVRVEELTVDTSDPSLPTKSSSDCDCNLSADRRRKPTTRSASALLPSCCSRGVPVGSSSTTPLCSRNSDALAPTLVMIVMALSTAAISSFLSAESFTCSSCFAVHVACSSPRYTSVLLRLEYTSVNWPCSEAKSCCLSTKVERLTEAVCL